MVQALRQARGAAGKHHGTNIIAPNRNVLSRWTRHSGLRHGENVRVAEVQDVNALDLLIGNRKRWREVCDQLLDPSQWRVDVDQRRARLSVQQGVIASEKSEAIGQKQAYVPPHDLRPQPLAQLRNHAIKGLIGDVTGFTADKDAIRMLVRCARQTVHEGGI